MSPAAEDMPHATDVEVWLDDATLGGTARVGTLTRRPSLLTFAALLKAEGAYDSIERLAFGRAHWRVRSAALEVAGLLAPGERDALWRRAELDGDPAVRRAARLWLHADRSGTD